MVNEILVEVVFATQQQQTVIALSVSMGTTALQAAQLSGLYDEYPHIQDYPLGVYGKVVAQDYVLEAHDRIEIYRPLLVDPKENRRRRAAQNKD
ncbi:MULTISPECIES: RnfH family protein [Vitreoscilla]|uniref:UPF0125 protein LVJ81_05235 n=1 Tax=Vitreoscilla stercoraria TaxID=61 RepID=A0ABY4EDI3_VITST|nr:MULTISPECIES: RnfH family protein [Vitreoscilla]AUZ05219.1 RnfH family ubiquitin [Vitreoscilla sp. C1]UOO93434.1 RnfH family protein [Vitreoscilla stercoraria]